MMQAAPQTFGAASVPALAPTRVIQIKSMIAWITDRGAVSSFFRNATARQMVTDLRDAGMADLFDHDTDPTLVLYGIKASTTGGYDDLLTAWVQAAHTRLAGKAVAP